MPMTFTAPHDLDLALTAYADVIARKRTQAAALPSATGSSRHYSASVTFERGSKYLRVVMIDGFGQSSAYAFIVAQDNGKFKVGDILKPASWKAPAKNFARGNVFRPETYERHSPYGL